MSYEVILNTTERIIEQKYIINNSLKMNYSIYTFTKLNSNLYNSLYSIIIKSKIYEFYPNNHIIILFFFLKMLLNH